MITSITPGDWTVRTGGADGSAEVCYTNPHGVLVAVAHVYNCEPDRNAEANALLIAACPVMYDFIQMHALNGDKKAQEILSTIEA